MSDEPRDGEDRWRPPTGWTPPPKREEETTDEKGQAPASIPPGGAPSSWSLPPRPDSLAQPPAEQPPVQQPGSPKPAGGSSTPKVPPPGTSSVSGSTTPAPAPPRPTPPPVTSPAHPPTPSSATAMPTSAPPNPFAPTPPPPAAPPNRPPVQTSPQSSNPQPPPPPRPASSTLSMPTAPVAPPRMPTTPVAPPRMPTAPVAPPRMPTVPSVGAPPRSELQAHVPAHLPSTARPIEPEPKRKAAGDVRRLRKGRLAIRKFDPVTVFKFSIVFQFSTMLVLLLATGLIYGALRAFGVIGSLEKFIAEMLTSDFEIHGGKILFFGFIGGCIWTVASSVVATFGAFMYNLIADVVGGIEMIVVEPEED